MPEAQAAIHALTEAVPTAGNTIAASITNANIVEPNDRIATPRATDLVTHFTATGGLTSSVEPGTAPICHNYAQIMAESADVEALRLGSVPYDAALALQRERRLAVERGTAREAVFLLQHPPVFTLGRNASESNLLLSREALAKLGVAVVETDRGGDVTYHGPGQLVAYPIIHLDRRSMSIRGYLRTLEQAIIETLAGFGITAGRVDGFTGVWVAGAKVAAIGIAVHHGISFHGVAINVDPNMDHWRLIVPCGIPDKPVTSLAALLGEAPRMREVEDAFAAALDRALTAAALPHGSKTESFRLHG